jgi:two-component system cell cycle sensor histidine kinase/response regulator CckA
MNANRQTDSQGTPDRTAPWRVLVLNTSETTDTESLLRSLAPRADAGAGPGSRIDVVATAEEALGTIECARADDRPFGCVFVALSALPAEAAVATADAIWERDPEVVIVAFGTPEELEESPLFAAPASLPDLLFALGSPWAAVEARQLAAAACARRAADAAAAREQRATIRDERLAAMGRLAGGIAHDFNNLLTAILSFSSFVQESLEPGDPRRSDLNEVIHAARRASTRTKQLLVFSQQTEDAEQRELVDLNELIGARTGLLRSLLGDTIELVLAPSEDAATVRADASQLERLLVNLVSNAKDAGAGRVTIELRAATGGEVVLAVGDTGHGIAPEALGQIFEPFYSTKANGTGLGLAAAHGIARRHGGSIEVRSELGRGTVFSVRLPAAAAGFARTPTGLHGVVPATRQRQVLVVDDQAAIRKLCARALRRRGLEVTEAADGQEALVLLEDSSFDLIVTDVVMPGLGGAELAERAAEICPRTPVLFISGYSEEALVRREVPGRRTRFLQKPFLPHDFGAAVSALIGDPTRDEQSAA